MNKVILYVCNNCDHKITDPIYSYERADHKWVSSDGYEFERMGYIHAGKSLITCDRCGSDDLHDPDDTVKIAFENGDL